jgi:RNase P/RNase MRP subunit p29
MKRLALAIFFALTLILTGGAVQTSAAARPPAPGINGQVASVEGSTIDVTTPRGTASILTTSSTTFVIDGASGSLSAITAGMFVHADGAKATDGTFTATRVVAGSKAPQGGQPPRGGPKGAGVDGKVASVNGSSITVTTPKGTASIITTSSTTFKVNGASGSLSDITAGMFVHAEGAKATDGTFTATSVVASSTRPAPPKHH